MNSARSADTLSKYYRQLRAFIRKRVMTADEAEDIVQTVFYQLAKADSLLSPIEHLTGWLYKTARHQIIDEGRKKKEVLLDDYLADSDDDDDINDLISLLAIDNSSPESEYLQNIFWGELEQALALLPEEQRQAFEMTELHGLSFSELAEQTGCNINTLMARKRYAVMFLRTYLADVYQDMLQQ
ncbi:RNA polymerase sigma factor SigZ [Pragia fontium]|uniref:RNA polymerase sigma factor SigZ n=1 Tax=Pragia fontium TaxID=82985 RepID=A0ABQ5LLG5_9GAMM|nr:sigma-70 family RNA polymerase sigma factor [Pragia fontium]GKX64460.1 RNA polymerase sigma factor SigZ [Pragia fontium]